MSHNQHTAAERRALELAEQHGPAIDDLLLAIAIRDERICLQEHTADCFEHVVLETVNQ